jgi:Secretion system C-terminal sorting domain
MKLSTLKGITALLSVILLSTSQLLAQPTQPTAPPSGNASNCLVLGTGNVPLDQCPVNSTVLVTNFQNGTYNSGNNGNNLGTNAVWRFPSIGVVNPGAIVVNATVTVIGSSNAILTNMDDNSGLDQNNVSVADFFAPVIQPDVALNNTDRRGYVQFRINFYQANLGNGYNNAIAINNLRLTSYDADGNFNTAGTSSQTWFRETRVASGGPVVVAAGTTELTGYGYTDAGTPWNGFAGGVYERTGISRCAEVASNFSFSGSLSSISVRFGYDFKAGTSGHNVGNPGRQYGAKFGCYSFPAQTTLPVKLLNFDGVLKNNTAYLNWAADNQVNFSAYDIERSINAIDFKSVGVKQRQGTGLERQQYQFADELSTVNSDAFFYRLKMVDIDGRYNYSNVIMVKKGDIKQGGLLLSPNPVSSNGIATVRFQAKTKGTVEFRVVDLSGRIVLKQLATVYDGTNSINIANLNRLQPGTYVLQMTSNNITEMTKFSVTR